MRQEKMNMPKIKICGLSRPEDITYINETKPDYCGFIIDVPKSRRNVSISKVRELVQNLESQICPVGVFVNKDCGEVVQLLNEGTIQIAQLHGQEDEAYIKKLKSLTDHPVMKAFSIQEKKDLDTAAASSADLILLDHGKGGTGETFDWSLLEGWTKRPYFLAGGLNPENIPEAIQRIHPWGIDLSSAVETDGKKDREKVLQAVKTVRNFESSKHFFGKQKSIQVNE